MYQPQLTAYLLTQLFAEYICKLSFAAAVLRNRYSARLIDDQNVVIVIYYLYFLFRYLSLYRLINLLKLIGEGIFSIAQKKLQVPKNIEAGFLYLHKIGLPQTRPAHPFIDFRMGGTRKLLGSRLSAVNIRSRDIIAAAY